METIVFEGRTQKIAEPLYGNHKDDSNLLEDIITIDSQIELKVSGEHPDVKALNGATQFIEQKMAAYLKHAYEEFRLPKQSIENGTINFHNDNNNNTAFDELRKFHLRKCSEMAELKTKSHRKNKFLFSIQPGFEIIIPPYDSEWTNSFVSYSSANKVSGSFNSFPIGNGYGGSSVGVFLSSMSDIWVRFNAHCPVSYSWSNFINEGGGYAASQGGLGITIYDASAGVLIKDEHETLWNQASRPSGMEISGSADDLYFQNTGIGENHFKMKSGHTYLIWMWCWAFADSGPNAAAYANIDCKVPFMIVDSSSL